MIGGGRKYQIGFIGEGVLDGESQLAYIDRFT